MKKISIDPITRLEGHGKIDIFLDDQGDVANAYFQVPELRGFEKFCEGRPAEEIPRIVPRICGVCPVSHHLASTKTVDAVWSVEPTVTAKKLRELMFNAHIVHSHTAHFYALAAPDFVLGPDAKPEERNILGVVAKVGLEIGKEVIKNRGYAQSIQAMLGGKATHPVNGLPGGVSKGLTEEERQEIETKANSIVEFAKLSLQIFEDVVLKNKAYVDLILGDVYKIDTYFMGMVDDQNRVNFYDGNIRVVDPEGKEFARFEPKDYLEHIQEEVEPWTYLKFPFLKKIGWTGMKEGLASSVYRVGPLARLNVAESMATPLAQGAFEKYRETLGKTVQATLAYHWARLIELMYNAERLLELSKDPEITNPDIRRIPTAIPSEGVGIVEAPRGTLVHHYKTDSQGMIEKVNLIVSTGHNNSAMNMSVKKAAQNLIKKGNVDQGLLNMVEMAFRAYDPCLACSTHSLPGQMPLEIRIFDQDEELCQSLRQ